MCGIPTREFLSIDGLAASAVTLGEITSLQHELRNDTVEAGTRIAKALLACGKLSEVVCSVGDDIIIQLEYNSTRVLAVDSDIKLHVKVKRGK